MRPRFSISRLMVFVAAIALGLALSVAAVNLRSGVVLALTAAILVLVTLGMLLRRGWLRAFCSGFVVFGWAYLGVASWSPQARVSLPTTRPLVHLGESVLRIAPAVKGPDDVVPMIQWLLSYLSVAHSLAALVSGLIGGSLFLVLGAAWQELPAVMWPAARVPRRGSGGADA